MYPTSQEVGGLKFAGIIVLAGRISPTSQEVGGLKLLEVLT